MENVDPTTTDEGDQQAAEPRSRRQLLRLAGAAAAGGAGLVIAGASPAEAASGGPLLMGRTNNTSEGDLTALNGLGFGSLHVGIEGFSNNTTALTAASVSYPDIKVTGTGRIGMTTGSTGNAQPSFAPILNDIVKSSTGALWSGKGDLGGSDGWKRINAVRVDNPNGNGSAFAPFRFYDSRNSSLRTVGSATTLNVRASANIPNDAIAIFGNLTVTGSNFGGWANIWPAGVSEPATSSINFTTGQSVANFFFVGLGTSVGNEGLVNIIPRRSSGTGTCHIIIDITAYVQ